MAISRLRKILRDEVERVRKVHNRNVDIFRHQPWREISGSFGDIGTFIPIFIALEGNLSGGEGTISASSTLVFSGLSNLLTGLFFGIPLPVQPMKAIAAVAIANPDAYNQARYASAGLFVAGVVAVLSLSGLIQWFTRSVPVPIVKGIQVGAGLSLIMSGFSSLPWKPQFWSGHAEEALVATVPAFLCLLLLLLCASRPRLPFVLIVVSSGVVIGIVFIIIRVASKRPQLIPGFSLWHPKPFAPSPEDFLYGAFNAGLGQVPLTTLNSIVAVVFLAEDLLPDAPPPSATAVGISVALMNLVGCWFKAMPVCHGSGGLAAQYRFGARSGASVMFLGSLKIVLGLFASQFVSSWCRAVPSSVLAILLILAGAELAKMGESLNSRGARDLWETDESDTSHSESKRFKILPPEEKMRRYLVMLVTGGAILGTRNDGIGFIVGLAIHFAYKFQDWEVSRLAGQEGQIRLGEDLPRAIEEEVTHE